MKIFTTSQAAEIDQYTIINEPIASIDLMERASTQLADWIVAYLNINDRIAVFAGTGNNGGDALAVARILAYRNFKVNVFIPDFGGKISDAFSTNRERLKELKEIAISIFNSDEVLPVLTDYDYIIDGLFGSGLSRPLTGFPALLVQHLNLSGIPIIAIDIPSGLMGEDNRKNNPKNIIQAHFTLTLQYPKLSFFFQENERFTGQWEVLPIGLHPDAIDQTKSSWYYSDFGTIVSLLKPRSKFSHKGTFGHALLVAGSLGKTGAAILAAKGCLKSGTGLVTVHLPHCGNQIIQTALPEAMVSPDDSENVISSIPLLTNYKAVGIGPGIGKSDDTRHALHSLLAHYPAPVVIDADALNLLSVNNEMIKLIPQGSILTPHPVEFERLAGHAESDYERLHLALRFAQIHHVILVLKGAYTAIALPDGNCWFNSTGNPGMATAGSGDVLTGIVTGMLAQGYKPEEAAILGVYLHGLAGDLAVKDLSEEALLAGDIADHLGKAFSLLKSDPGFGKAKKKTQF